MLTRAPIRLYDQEKIRNHSGRILRDAIQAEWSMRHLQFAAARWEATAYRSPHATGEVRGLLCIDSNTTLGRMKDDTKLLLSAIEYLQKSEEEHAVQ